MDDPTQEAAQLRQDRSRDIISGKYLDGQEELLSLSAYSQLRSATA
jgi:hypothetical protein